MANLFELAAKLTLDSSDYEKGIEAAKQAAANFSKGLTAIVTVTQNADRAVTAAADSAEQFSTQTSNAADSAEEFRQAETQVTRAAEESANSMSNAADSAENLSQSAENASESISETTRSADSSASKFKNFQSAIQTIISKFGEFARSNSTVRRAVETVKTKFETFRGVLDKAKSKIQEVTDKGKNLADRGLSKIQSGIEKVKSKFEPAINAFSKAKGWLEKLKDKFKKVGDEEDKTSEKTLKFKDIVKSILTADAIKAGLGMLWNGVKRIGQAFISVGKQAVEAYGNYEQLAGGAKKIFENMDFSQIEKDAKLAYKELNMSASQYLEAINLAGSSFAQTMGDKKGYETARKGMIAIADYASGTGKNINELNQKYQMISRSASVYQSIADQFSGILPQTSADFLKQAQSAGFLEKEYKKLTEVPVAEYQEAVTKMIEKGVGSLGLLGNTAKESTETLTGSLAMTKAAWENLLVAIADEDADFDGAIDNLIESATAAGQNLIPRVEQVIKGIGRAIEKLLPIALEEAPKAIARYAPEVLESVKSLFSVIYNSLQNLLTETDWNVLGGKIADGINNIDWVTLFAGAAQNLGNALVATLNLLSGFIENVDWFKLGVEIFYSVVTVVENIDWQEVVATAFRLLGSAIGGAGALIGGLSMAIKSVFDQARTEVKAYFDAKIKEAGGNIVKGIFNGIIEAGKNVDSWIYNNIFLPFINGFKAAFGIHSPSTVMITMGKYLIDGLLNGIKNAPARVMEVFAQVKNKITSWGSGILTTIRQIGGHLMTGLISGINDKVGSVYKKISDVGQSIVSKVKNVFGVHSPSTVMKQIGDYLMQGLSIGVDSNAYKPIRSVSNVGDEMTRAFDFDGPIGRIGGAIGVSGYTSQGTNTERLLMLILETLRDMDESMYERISSAIDGMAIDWNDRELGRFVKSYA